MKNLIFIFLPIFSGLVHGILPRNLGLSSVDGWLISGFIFFSATFFLVGSNFFTAHNFKILRFSGNSLIFYLFLFFFLGPVISIFGDKGRLFASAVIFNPILEEFLARGFLVVREKNFRTYLLIFFVSISFALAHWIEYPLKILVLPRWQDHLQKFGGHFLWCGISLSLITLETKRLDSAILIHATGNFIWWLTQL